MLIKSIKLNNFRNYSSIQIPFHEKLNIIIGPNGIGKTNILESIIVASNTKSFRTNNDSDLIKKDSEYSKVSVDSNIGKLDVVINRNNKSLIINDNPVKRSSEFIGKLNAILFKPSDLELFNQSPKERRKLLDVEIGKISKEYLKAILTYNHLLKDKNKLLKEEKIDEIYLDLLDKKMIPEIFTIISHREKFFNIINSNINYYYQKLSGTNTNIKVIYKKCSDKELIKENLNKTREKDEFYHYSYYGPHHDDYYFEFNGKELNSIASQGQIRMCLIAFKFSLIKYIKETSNVDPIILLDDVLSELDINNQKRLLENLPKNCQVIITDTDIDGIKNINDYNLIELKEK